MSGCSWNNPEKIYKYVFSKVGVHQSRVKRQKSRLSWIRPECLRKVKENAILTSMRAMLVDMFFISRVRSLSVGSLDGESSPNCSAAAAAAAGCSSDEM